MFPTMTIILMQKDTIMAVKSSTAQISVNNLYPIIKIINIFTIFTISHLFWTMIAIFRCIVGDFSWNMKWSLNCNNWNPLELNNNVWKIMEKNPQCKTTWIFLMIMLSDMFFFSCNQTFSTTENIHTYFSIYKNIYFFHLYTYVHHLVMH